jgi:glycine cleavage system H protein
VEYKIPSELNYAPTHEWVKLNNKIATVGITDYAQHQLGDIVFVELPEVGHIFEKDSIACEIESVKAVGEFYMPLSGEIVEINENIADNPELVNQSPYDEGWILKINITHSEELYDLLSAEDYKELIEKEEK